MREIVLDTETTGLDPKSGHRIVEIGAIELINHIPTDNIYHCDINPEREVDHPFGCGAASSRFADRPTFEEGD